MIEFILGLPYLRDGHLWRAARRLRAPVLISVNALSLRPRDAIGLRTWRGFDQRNLRLVHEHPVHLDSAGFVAAMLYNGFEFTVDAYLDLCAAAPWRWFASMDMCVEPEIARDEETVRDRIAGTVRLNRECLLRADDRGIAHRLLPVIQGYRVEHYLRCIDRMPFLSEFRLIGIGSMCRRHVEDSEVGILRIVDELDRAFEGTDCRFHLFGLKATGMSAIRGHPRIGSCDSQAYGVAARRQAHENRASKTNAYLARLMSDWYRTQQRLLAAPNFAFHPPVAPVHRQSPPLDASDARIAAAAEELRRLYEAGEIEWPDISPLRALQWAFEDDDEAEEEDDAVAI
jgi:hypothetical protein